MSENFVLPDSSQTKEESYKVLIPQIEALVIDEQDLIANLSNIVSALKYGMNFFWIGFYFVKGDELVLGPFQGPVACTRIGFGKGVCGTSWKEKKIIIVPNVDDFPGHISCNSESKSEIVLPLILENEVKLILDVDSSSINNFDETDRKYLAIIMELIAEIFI